MLAKRKTPPPLPRKDWVLSGVVDLSSFRERTQEDGYHHAHRPLAERAYFEHRGLHSEADRVNGREVKVGNVSQHGARPSTHCIRYSKPRSPRA